MAEFKTKTEEEKFAEEVKTRMYKLLDASPRVLEKVRENRKFIEDLKSNPVPKDKENISVFGVKNVNVNAIAKNNIWNATIFTTSHINRMVFNARFEQLKKYQKRKPPLQFNYAWLIILAFGIVIALLVIIFLLPVVPF